VPPDDLKACLYMAFLRVIDFLKEETGMTQPRGAPPRTDFKQTFLQGALVIVDGIDNASLYTRNHSRMVGKYAGQLAALARLSDDDIEQIEYAALIHNIGRINEEPALTDSKRRLSDKELVQARDHCLVAAEMLRPINFLTPIVPMVRHHHTRYDGTGYPGGVSGDDIPLGARIIAIADAYHAMRCDRPWRKALTREQALLEIDKNAGKQFDPKLTPLAHDLWEG